MRVCGVVSAFGVVHSQAAAAWVREEGGVGSGSYGGCGWACHGRGQERLVGALGGMSCVVMDAGGRGAAD